MSAYDKLEPDGRVSEMHCDAGARPARMDAPGGPLCGCGRPSHHESGWCGLPTKDDLGLDERMTIAEAAGSLSKRLRMGAQQYGPLDIASDGRDMLVELEAEIVDASAYIRWALKQRTAERRAYEAEINRLRDENDRLRAEAVERMERNAHLEAWCSALEKADGGC